MKFVPRRICSCAACGTKKLTLKRLALAFGESEYCIEHEGKCTKGYWYADRKSINTAVKAWNNMNDELVDGFELIWFEVDRVYATRIDCMAEPERVRQAA